MKKTKTLKLAFAISLMQLFHSATFCQLNGTYTIGGITPDYPAFADAVNALATSGVSGAVTFNVRSGIYNEQITIDQIAGVSSGNTVTFQSETLDSTAVTLTFASSPTATDNFTLKLNGCDYVSFKLLTIERSGTDVYSRVVEIANGSDNNKILNSVIKGVVATTATTNNVLIYSATGATSVDLNNEFWYNKFTNGAYGFYYYAGGATAPESGTIISNNDFENVFGRGIYMSDQIAPIIEKNNINVTSTYTAYYGIYCNNCDQGIVIRKNKIVGLAGGYGIYMSASAGLLTNPGKISNNFISVGGIGTCYGLYLNSAQNTNISFNSILVSGTSTTASRAVYIIGTTSTKLDFTNNIFAATGGGYAFYISVGNAISSSNHNDLFTTGVNIGYWNTAAVTSFANWQSTTGYDGNSVNANPLFISNIDLHTSAVQLNNVAVPITGITTDIDEDVRNASTPDIGADEFDVLTTDVGILSIVEPFNGSCGSSVTILKLALKNFASVAQSNFQITIDVTGAVTQTINTNYTQTIAGGALDTIIVSANIYTSGGGVFNFKCYTSLLNDQNFANDTAFKSLTFQPVPSAPNVNLPITSCKGPVTLTASGNPGDLFDWYNTPTGGTSLYSGAVYTPVVNTSSVYYVEKHTGSVFGKCLKISEVNLNTSNFIEIQNVTNDTIYSAGWTVAVSNSYSNINLANATFWPLSDFNPGEIQYKSDNVNDNYWGSAILWAPLNKGWGMIIDNTGNIVDFLVWGWSSADILNMDTIINSFPIIIGTNWYGNSYTSCGINKSISRLGSSDNNNAADLSCQTLSKGISNPAIVTPFPTCNIGQCASDRTPDTVNILPAPPVFLGNDTTIYTPNTLTLNAGSGLATYLWSNGATTQTIIVTSQGQYCVTVTDGNGCANTDCIYVNVILSIDDVSAGQISIYPNPANDHFTITVNDSKQILKHIELINPLGQVILKKEINSTGSFTKDVDLTSFDIGVYVVRMVFENSVVRYTMVIR